MKKKKTKQNYGELTQDPEALRVRDSRLTKNGMCCGGQEFDLMISLRPPDSQNHSLIN